jgi:iron(III) transport system permease protein
LGESPLVLSLSFVMLVVAYVIRFISTGYNDVEAGYDKVGLKYMEASRMLGMGTVPFGSSRAALNILGNREAIL